MIEFLKKNKILLFFAVLVIVQGFWIFHSSGFYFIDDSCHFNYNRHVLTSYDQSIGSWHRLGRVWLYALPAQFGLKGTQIFASLVFLFTIFVCYKILRIKKVDYAEWIVFAIGFQPVLFNISYTVLAELPAACLIALSFYYYLKDKYIPVMLLSSFIFLFRSEYYFVAGLFLLVYLFRKKWISIFLFAAGPVLWFLVSWIISGQYWRFFYDIMLHTRLPKITEGIEWYYYIKYTPVIFGVIQTLFFIIGVISVFIMKRVRDFGLILMIIIGGFTVHTLAALKGLDLTCSVGQLRYLAVIGPMFGIISVFGLEKLFKLSKNKSLLILLQVIIFFVLFTLGPYSTPFHAKFHIETACDEISGLVKEKYPDYTVLSNLHYIANSMDKAASGEDNFQILTTSNLNKYHKALIIWDSDLEGSPFVEETVTLDKLEKLPDVKLIITKIDTVDHRPDIPIYRFYNYDSKIRREAFKYLTNNQYCWENFELKVFLKN